MSFFPSSVPTALQLLDARNNKSVTLTSAINDVITTIPVADTSNIPTAGYLTFEDGSNECIQYTGVTATTLTGVTRGADGTTASAHSNGGTIGMWGNARYHNIIKEEVIAIAQNLSDRIGLSSTQLLAPLGSFSLPTYSFAGDPDTGAYSGGANRYDIAVGGVDILTVLGVSVTSVVPWLAPDGGASAPAYAFSTATAYGFYKSGNDIAVTQAGTARWTWDGTSFFQRSQGTWGIQVGFGSSGTPSIGFVGDEDSGWYRVASGEIGMVNDGALVWKWNSTGQRGTNNDAKIFAADGSVSSPTYTFANDNNTGMFSYAADKIGFAAGGGSEPAASIESGMLRIYKDDGKLSFRRQSNAREHYIQVLNSNAGARYHAGPSGGAELTVAAHQFTSDAPSAATILMTILGGGDVAIGTDPTTSERLYVLADASKNLLRLRSTNTTANTITAFKIETGIASGGIGTGSFMYFQDGGSDVFKMVGSAGQLQAHVGSVGAPTYSFLLSPTSGFYRSASNEISVTTNSTQRFKFTALGSFESVGGADILTGDGTVSNPGYTFSNDPNTGFARGATGRIDVIGDGVISAFHHPVTTSDGVQHTPFQVRGGGGGNGGLTSLENYTKTAVGTSALDIYFSTAGDGNLVIVFGKSGSQIFTDILVSSFSTVAPVVISSHTSGGPAARTYAQGTAGHITLQMASGAYDVHSFGLAVTTRS